MREFFRPWRRKVGLVTLLLAFGCGVMDAKRCLDGRAEIWGRWSLSWLACSRRVGSSQHIHLGRCFLSEHC